MPSEPRGSLPLRTRLLLLLEERSAETRTLATAVGVAEPVVMRALEALAEAGVVDAHDPPPPCGRENLQWFILPRWRAPAATP